MLHLPEVEVFDWPSRFLVEAREPDRALREIFGDDTPYPYLVDIDENECPCYDFQQNITKFQDGRQQCKHLIAANRYRYLMINKPKPLPEFEI